MSEKILKYCSIIAVAAAVTVACIIAYKSCINTDGGGTRTVTYVDTIVTHDTIVQPTTVTVTARHTDTIFVSDLQIDTVRDTLFVLVPMTQTLYHYPDTADIYVSGYRARIDSVSLVYHEKTVYLERPTKPLKFGLETGICVAMGERRAIPSLYIDAGMTIRNKFSVKFGIGANYDNGVKAFMHGGVAYIIR